VTEDIQVKREIVLEADAETLQRMQKEGHARGFTVYCAASAGLLRSLIGVLTADADFPVRGNAQNPYRQSQGVCHRPIQERRFRAA
jgi:hypothetical protein